MSLRQILIGIFLCTVASVCLAKNKPSISSFTGKWLVSDVVGYSEISGGPLEAKRLLGEILTISKNRIDFDDESCTPDNGFVVRRINTASEFSGNDGYGKFYFPALGLPTRTIMLDSSNCLTVLKASDYSVAFGWDGVILRAYK